MTHLLDPGMTSPDGTFVPGTIPKKQAVANPLDIFLPDGRVDYARLVGHPEHLYRNPLDTAPEMDYLEHPFAQSYLGRVLKGERPPTTLFPRGWETWPVVSFELADGTIHHEDMGITIEEVKRDDGPIIEHDIIMSER